MIAAPHIELATPADLDALASMRAELGWHRSESLLASLLAWERGRTFVVRAGSLIPAYGEGAQTIAATTSALAAGPIGVIGNVAVRDEFQRRGLGSLLTAHALAWQRSADVRSVWLDATPAGRPLYRRLGFEDVTASWDVHTPMRELRVERLEALAAGVVVTPRQPDALASVAALDREAFGGDRLGLLHALATQDNITLYIAQRAGDVTQRPLGFAFTRRIEAPNAGIRLGPLVASNDTVAAALTLAAVRAERSHAASAVDSGALYLIAGGGGMPWAQAFFDHIGAPTHDDDLVMRLALGADDDETVSHEPPAKRRKGRPSIYAWVSPMLF